MTGFAKAPSTVGFINQLFDGTFEADAIVADVLSPGEKKEEVESALNEAEVVLDFSASVPVARYLSHDSKTMGRRISVFLNPSGTDLVILAEDEMRSITLADLEMQLYHAIITDENWRGHLQSASEMIRYTRSCGDLSGRIPQDFIASHAATTSRALRRTIPAKEASIGLWRLDAESDGLVRRTLTPEPVVEVKSGTWTVRADQGLIRKIHKMRAERLPVETGGVLVGSFDTQRKIVYLVDALPAPPDSEERQDSFVRGCVDLKENIAHIRSITANQVLYAGEWHSHTAGRNCQPSRKDFTLFNVLATQRLADGLPPLMLIVGDNNEFAWFVEQMPEPPESTKVLCVVQLAGGNTR